MKYIVKTEGKVYDWKQAAYAVEAQSESEAVKIAEERFAKEYIIAGDGLKTSARKVRASVLIALVTLSAAAVISLIGFRTAARNPVTIRPDMMSLLYGALVYLILLVKFKGAKNLLKADTWKEMTGRWENIVLAGLVIVLFASVIQLMFSEMKVGVSFLSVNLDLRVLALGLALIAYFTNGGLSIICFVLFFLLSKASISGLIPVLSNVKGMVFLACAFIGIISYLSAQPALYQSFLNVKALVNNPAKKLRNAAENEEINV